MSKENRKYTVPTFVAVAFMFVWIILTVFLTGGREISDFTEQDKTIFSVFIILEVLTLAFIIICLIKAQKLSDTKSNNIINNINKTVDKRHLVINVSSFAALTVTLILGIFTEKYIDDDYLSNISGIICAIALCLPILFLILNVIIKLIYKKRLGKRSFAENQQFLFSHRDDSKERSKKKLYILKILIIINDIYSIFLSVCAFVSAFFSGIVSDGRYTCGLLLVCYMVLTAATLRIRLEPSDGIFEDDKTYVNENDYPALYNLAKKAATVTGCDGAIKIAILDDFNAGAAIFNNTISIQLGALLLNVLSEDEVYCVLLHEFFHIKDELNHRRISKFNRYVIDFQNNEISNFYSNITKHLFSFLDIYYNLQYNLYLYSVSLSREFAADKNMAIYGDSKTAASSLIKIKYYELYDWEKGTYDTTCNFETAEYDTDSLNTELQRFKEAVSLNAEKWNGLINNEILSRSASHPTLKMRLENLGIDEIITLKIESSAEYIADCEKAIIYVSSLIAEQSKDSYEEYRKYYYIESKELVEKWEQNGRTVIAEEYRDICDALRRLGRNSEALELCENAIKLLDDVGSCYAYFVKGCFLLHSFNEAGIEYIYKAIENNHNYVDEGLSEIGSFCCLTGQEDQLEIYRERAIALTEENKTHSEASVLNKKDRLSTESLPDGMLDDILSHITSSYCENIEKIYLVRKTITDDFFSSVFVIKISSDTDDDIRYKILQKAFNYLDTCSEWQFSLFDYDDVKDVKIELIPDSCVYSK
ncbi:MAG: hypothetical protein E7535_04250 [Ruminococcaceae bacterium]|nr:hypothetical protein [Oscillospiraceae bacterium]